MAIYSSFEVARNGRDHDYLIAERFYEEAVLESNALAKVVEAANLRRWDAYRQMEDAATKYCDSVGRKNSCGVVWPSPCECDVGDCQ